MKLYPAIDILDKLAVRLLKGRREDVTIYGDPVELAYSFVELGAQNIHIVDLNGAFDSTTINMDIIKQISKIKGVTLQLGGGLKSFDKVRFVLDDLGIHRAIVGSMVVTDWNTIERLANIYKNRIVGGLDVLDGRLAIKGWVEYSTMTPLTAALRLKEIGIEDVIFTDISKDGALSGINLAETSKLQVDSGLNVIASGGVTSYQDLEDIKNNNIYGAILGKAMYNKNIELKEALKYVD